MKNNMFNNFNFSQLLGNKGGSNPLGMLSSLGNLGGGGIDIESLLKKAAAANINTQAADEDIHDADFQPADDSASPPHQNDESASPPLWQTLSSLLNSIPPTAPSSSQTSPLKASNSYCFNCSLSCPRAALRLPSFEEVKRNYASARRY